VLVLAGGRSRESNRDEESACGPSAARSRRARASGGGAPRALIEEDYVHHEFDAKPWNGSRVKRNRSPLSPEHAGNPIQKWNPAPTVSRVELNALGLLRSSVRSVRIENPCVTRASKPAANPRLTSLE
jgi:hypothetical protein